MDDKTVTKTMFIRYELEMNRRSIQENRDKLIPIPNEITHRVALKLGDAEFLLRQCVALLDKLVPEE